MSCEMECEVYYNGEYYQAESLGDLLYSFQGEYEEDYEEEPIICNCGLRNTVVYGDQAYCKCQNTH